MTELFDWIKKMIYLSIFLTLLLQILPAGTYRKYVKFFAGLVFVISVAGPLTRILGQEDWEDALAGVLAGEHRREEQLDFDYMEERQREIYAENASAAVEELVRSAVSGMGFEVEEVDVTGYDEENGIGQVSVRAAEVSAADAERIRRKVADLLSIGNSQVEVKGG